MSATEMPMNQFCQFDELELRTNPGAFPGPMVQDLGTVPAFASYPEADKTIYLDFNGHTTTGTSWNNSKRPSFDTPAYDTDGSPATFSVAEQDAIREIFLRVSEDFAPFTINVTTIEPSVEDLRKWGVADTRWGVRVAIGGSYSDWWGIANSGIAYTQSFHYSDDTPAFVFADTLQDNTRWIAETASHEAGHTLGLYHDGITGSAYYGGHGQWSPIMGHPYDERLVTQWDKGQYPGATNTQDDLATITNPFWNGVSYRPDDYAAPVMLGVDLTASGIIERNTDTDTFGFVAEWNGDKPASKQVPTRIVVSPAAVGANLDIRATLRDAAGNVVAESAPLNQLEVDFTVSLRAGRTYYLTVEGDGNGTDYTRYGSLGQYRVAVIKP